tara:strand:- start:190 stop:669 length:480 start_codon:yes stop_codon:yes gene_type:complete
MLSKKDNICSICLEECDLRFCRNCNNYVHIECIKNYINNDYKSIYLPNNDSLSIKCFICKTNDSGFILTKYRFYNIFLSNLTEDYEYLEQIHYFVKVMLFNEKLKHNICFELILLRIIESKNILYNKVDIFRNKINSQLITYRYNCNNPNNIKLINKLI